MDAPIQDYGIELEHVFNQFCSSERFCADSFRICIGKAVEDGLNYLAGVGVISVEDIALLLSEYDFTDIPLRVYVKEKGAQNIEEFISQINAMGKKRNENEQEFLSGGQLSN